MENKNEMSLMLPTAALVNVLAGIWLVIAPYVIGYSHNILATRTDIAIGVIAGIVGLIRLTYVNRFYILGWLNVILGLWLIIAPYAARGMTATPIRINDVILGIIVAVLGARLAMSEPILQKSIGKTAGQN